MALDKNDISFLKEMLGHHEAALVMTAKVLKTTSDPAVKSLANSITEKQTAEIGKMKSLLGNSGESSTPKGHDSMHKSWDGIFGTWHGE